jgi:hypothetical protein
VAGGVGRVSAGRRPCSSTDGCRPRCQAAGGLNPPTACVFHPSRATRGAGRVERPADQVRWRDALCPADGDAGTRQRRQLLDRAESRKGGVGEDPAARATSSALSLPAVPRQLSGVERSGVAPVDPRPRRTDRPACSTTSSPRWFSNRSKTSTRASTTHRRDRHTPRDMRHRGGFAETDRRWCG